MEYSIYSESIRYGVMNEPAIESQNIQSELIQLKDLLLKYSDLSPWLDFENENELVASVLQQATSGIHVPISWLYFTAVRSDNLTLGI